MTDAPDSATRTTPNAAVDTTTAPLRPEMSLGELFGEMTKEFGDLMRAELELAKTEAKDEVSRAGKVAGMFGGAGVPALLALTFLSAGLAWLLDQALNTVLSFALVGLLWVAITLVLRSLGKKKAKDLAILPVTKETIKEDVQWVKAQKS